MLTPVLRGLCGICFVLLVGLSLGLRTPATAVAAAPVSKAQSPATPVIRVEDADERRGVDETSLLDATIAGLGALGGLGLGVLANRGVERRKVGRAERTEQMKDLDALVDRVSDVTNRLPIFATGDQTRDDVLGFAADVRGVADARNRVWDSKVRGAVDVFTAGAQEIVRDPLPGAALSDQVDIVARAADMVKKRCEEAKDALRAERRAL